MSEEAAFLRAIHADPDDDTPRLVFADWLQETGDRADAEWAELIRLQVRLARGAGAEREQLVARDRELELLVRARWPLRAESVSPAAAKLEWTNWSRGFPLMVSGSGRAIREARPAFAGRVPVREFTIRAARDTDLVAFASWPEMHLVRRLGVWTDLGMITEVGLMALAGCEHLCNLERLQMQWVEYSNRAVEAFVDSPHLQNLRDVKVIGRNFSSLSEEVRLRVRARFRQWDVY